MADTVRCDALLVSLNAPAQSFTRRIFPRAASNPLRSLSHIPIAAGLQNVLSAVASQMNQDGSASGELEIVQGNWMFVSVSFFMILCLTASPRCPTLPHAASNSKPPISWILSYEIFPLQLSVSLEAELKPDLLN